MTTRTLFAVHDRGGVYTTQTVHGQRASCTHSARAAAEALARKLYPHHATSLKVVDKSLPGVQVFELEVLS